MPKETVDIVIVGHGKSPVGKGWGKKIDAADYVVRMWDWHWQNPEDYGTKYDFGFFEIFPSMMADMARHNQHKPKIGWVGSKLFPISPPHSLPRPCEIVDQDRWCQMGIKMGGLGATGKLKLTRGGICACWAIEHAEKGDRITLVGYDNIHAGKTLPPKEGFPQEYLDAPSTYTFRGYVDNVQKYGNHDFGIELPLMHTLARKREVIVQFSQDVWQ